MFPEQFEWPFPIDLIKFRVHFMCNQGGIYGLFGYGEKLLHLFVYCRDAVLLYGHSGHPGQLTLNQYVIFSFLIFAICI